MIKFAAKSPTFDKFIRDFPQHFEAATKYAASETAGNIRSEMQVTPPARNQNDPVNWDSTKQKIAFFASDGFGEGIPYVRQGSYPQSFQVAVLPMGAKISAKSPAGAIGGTLGASGATISDLGQLESWQSEIHKGRWKPLLPVARAQLGKLFGRIVTKLKSLVPR